MLQPEVGADAVGEPVGPGGAVGVGPAQPGEPERGALDGDGGVLGGHPDDGLADLGGQRPRLVDGGRVERQLPTHFGVPAEA